MERERVLICLFGVVGRSIRYTHSSIKTRLVDKILEEYDVDIYVFNMDIGDILIDGVKIDKTETENILRNMDSNVVIEEYNQNSFDREVQDKWGKYGGNKLRFMYTGINPTMNGIRQLYSEHRVGSWLEKNKEKYRCCVVCGPDYQLLNDVNMNDIKESINNRNLIFTTRCNPAYGYTNGFYIGGVEGVIKVLRRYEYMGEYMPVKKDYEYVVKWAVDYHKLEHKLTDMLFFKIRNNRKIARQGIMSSPLYNSEYKECLKLVSKISV